MSHRLLSFSENFSHDPKGWKLRYRHKMYLRELPISPKKIYKRYSLAVFLRQVIPSYLETRKFNQ